VPAQSFSSVRVIACKIILSLFDFFSGWHRSLPRQGSRSWSRSSPWHFTQLPLCVHRVCGRGSCWRSCYQSLGRTSDSSASSPSVRNSSISWGTSSLPWPALATAWAGPHSRH
jgi:hypothetical protein